MQSVKAGANVITGGEVPSQTGYYYPTTMLDDLAPGMPANDEELICPDT